MSAELISGYAGVLLSLFMSYIPGLNAKYELLDGVYKRVVMLFLLAVVAVGVYATACLGYAEQFGVTVSCDTAGATLLIRVFVAAVILNQTTYLIAPK